MMPKREDLFDEGEYADVETQLHRHVLYQVAEGDIVVVDARGDMTSGIFGDMMMTYFKGLKGAGVVIDGCVRDWAKVEKLGIPMWLQGGHAELPRADGADADGGQRAGGLRRGDGDPGRHHRGRRRRRGLRAGGAGRGDDRRGRTRTTAGRSSRARSCSPGSRSSATTRCTRMPGRNTRPGWRSAAGRRSGKVAAPTSSSPSRPCARDGAPPTAGSSASRPAPRRHRRRGPAGR